MMNYYNKTAEKGMYYGNLPHLRQDSVCYFVTFRTADSIPQSQLKQWINDRDLWLLEHKQPLTDEQLTEYYKLFSRKLERWLDHGYGECLLKNQQCKQIVSEALLHFDNIRYTLWEYTVAVNHVHLLIVPYQDYSLQDILRSIKSFTANEINKATGRVGHFWQKEYFDHIVRNEEQLIKFVKYIRRHEHKVETSSRRFDVEMTSCRLQKDKLKDEAYYNTRQDDVSTMKLQDEASTNTRQDDVSTTESTTEREQC